MDRSPSPSSSSVRPPSPSLPFLVRALHTFDPSSLLTSTSTGSSQQIQSCLAFEAGTVLRCLGRDESGWWDGEIVEWSQQDGGKRVGKRGWFPSNYVEVLGVEEEGAVASGGRETSDAHLSQAARTLLHAIDQNVGLLNAAVADGKQAHYQASTACLISSIRTVLSSTSALTRDSPVLRSHPSLASARKKILSSLAHLVNQARKASSPAEDVEREEAEEMRRIAGETVAHVRKFVELSEQKGVVVDLGTASSGPIASTAGKEVRAAKSMGNLRRPTVGALENPQVGTTLPIRSSPRSRSAEPAPTSPFLSSASSHLIFHTPSSLSTHLSTLHDSLLSTLAALIGHVHSHSRSSSPAASFARLIDLTREAIERVRDVLVVVEKVGKLAPPLSPDQEDAQPAQAEEEEVSPMKVLARTREKLYEATTALVQAARIATAPSSSSAPSPASSSPRKNSVDSIHTACTSSTASDSDRAKSRNRRRRDQDEQERKLLLSAATAVLRAGGDCVGAVKNVVGVVASTFKGEDDKVTRFEVVLPRSRAGEDEHDERRLAAEDKHADARSVRSVGSTSTKYADAEEDVGGLVRPTSAISARQPAPSSPGLISGPRSSPAAAAAAIDARRRNSHTISMLGRKATSLGCLKDRYTGDGIEAGPVEGLRGMSLAEGDEGEEEQDRQEATSTNETEQATAASVPHVNHAKTPSTPLDSPALSMHRQHSTDSTRSHQSSSRHTNFSHASSSNITAETSPRSSMQATSAKSVTGHSRSQSRKSLVRTSLGSVRESLPAPPSIAQAPTLPTPGTTPRGSVSSSGLWFLQRDYLPREISFNADGHVSGGTLPCLVERMTLHDTTIDAAFSNTFLLTFRLFTTPLELARLLWTRFNLSPPRHPETGAELSADEMKQWTAQKLTPIRLRIYNLFKIWVESYWLHEQDREIVGGLLEWCQGRLKAAMPAASNRLVDLVNKRVAAAEPAGGHGNGFVQHSNASSTSVESSSASHSVNDSTLCLAVSNTTPAMSIRSGLTGHGGFLFRMQSTDKLKGVKGLAPISTARVSSDSYTLGSPSATSAPSPVVTKSLVAALRPALSGRTPLLSSVVEIDALELARQLTILESRTYCSIRADELLGSSAATGDAKGPVEPFKARNVRKMSTLSTRLTGWITETILGEQDQKRRTALLKYFIKVGERLLALANYNALFAVFTALNSSTISRLRKTWDGIAPKYKAVFDTLRKATDHGRNYAEYRQKIRQAVPPCLPFVGLFLTDLIFVFEGNRAERPSPVDSSLQLINFDRYHKMARIVGELQRFQSPYPFVEVPEIQAYLSQQLEGLKRGQDAQSLYRQSLLIEPRQALRPGSSAASIISSNDGHKHRDLFNWRG
ncbi:ras-like guanine nucleotide exchange factor [Rhodotorula toruloides]|uniref:Ras-like guanine nucleotide exchange factor n=1 Tax=Rhodotorula toruloides TaxID=5286 RepID=A0A511KKS2_RHOTO|nr:ras-like guanine nucleotide exchange factor [Rhodotorula toruloides]